MINLMRTDSQNKDFISLVKLLDDELARRDGEEHPFYAQFNKIQKIRHVIIAYDNNIPLGCGAIKKYNSTTSEVKRMYTKQEARSRGIATEILKELEIWSAELLFKRCILETGKKQPEAIALYKKNGYEIIPNYGQYENVENSICFEKFIR